MNRTPLLPALLLSLSLVAAGCGGDDANDDEKAAPLSKADFTTQANKICADGNAEIQAALEEYPDAPSEEEVAQAAEEILIPNLQQQHDDLAALGAPEGDEEEVQAILDALQDGIDTAKADPSALMGSDDPFQEASELAGEYGLEECAL